MWWRRFFVLLALVPSACGFQPLYSQGAFQNKESLPVVIDSVPDQTGQYLRNALIDRLTPRGVGETPRYRLTLEPVILKEEELGLRRDATTTRGQITLTSQFTLRDQRSDQIILSRSLRVWGGYNQLDNRFASLISREDLLRRLLDEMAAKVEADLRLFAARQP